jgi:hypothetical protein
VKLISALASLAMLGGVTLATGTASAATPVMNPIAASQTQLVQKTALVCNAWDHCWDRPFYGYYRPYYWHHWHPHYWSWHPWWYRWHYWHSW